ncbi:hypothetical protein CROQUDRAFT_51186 [Cronartium quercuum f. sp. fusiforme G11]|uniref:Integrase zinc-binding domain-containing protein n=1 Tax=Cronartium quercuum f. sp. fusiforme G11 TaxID=708437 RepID=A0A9P6N8Y7_9BASI|nr:hypothetical protein CROQUDRAFT_51186 [Cronartium quercuum f. sp. fusiforme G11]
MGLEDEQAQSASRNSERLIMSCTNGSDGYPAQIEFNRRMENYIGRKKRSERTVVNEEELASIHRLLSDPAAMRAETDASHRTWVKKTFTLRPFGAAGSIVCHRDKGQSIPQPIASKEQMYFILKQAHASEGHGGRDKTAKAVKKTHSFIRKGLICLFLEVCPTCRARNDAVKKDKNTNAQAFGGTSSFSGDDRLPVVWGMPYDELSSSSDLSPQGFLPEQCPGANLANSAARRPPTVTESGGMVIQPNHTHLRNNTYPQIDVGHGLHLAGPDPNLYPLELTSPTPFNPFSVRNFQNPQASLPPTQLTRSFISMNPEMSQLNHSNMVRHNTQILQQKQQQRQQRHSPERPTQSHNGKNVPPPLLSESNFHDFQRDEFLRHQQQFNLATQQHLQTHPQKIFNNGEFMQSPSYQPSHQPPSDALVSSSNLYDPVNVAFLFNQRGLEHGPSAEDGLLHVGVDLQHERATSTNTANEQFGALALRDSSVGPQTASSHVHYGSAKAYQPSPSGTNSDLFPISSGLSLENTDFLGAPHDGFEYQTSSGPSTGTSFWTRPDEMQQSALTGGIFNADLKLYPEDQSDKGSELHQRSSTNPQPSTLDKQPAAFRSLLSFSQHRSGSAPPLALVTSSSSIDGASLSASGGPAEGNVSSEMPRSAPANMSNPMQRSLEDFLAQIPQEGSISEEFLQQLLGHAPAPE